MTTEKNKNEKTIVTTILGVSGMKVEADLSKADGHCLMKAREASGGLGAAIYIMSEIATFDGQKLPAPEILNLNAYDIMDIEELWASQKKQCRILKN